MANGHQPILAVRNLKTCFFQDEGTVIAVDGVSFDVYAGRILGIVGESGCGKSVTARSILRIVEHPGRIVGGEIWLNRQATCPGLEKARASGRSVLNQPYLGEGYVDLVKLNAKGKEMRSVRGREIGLVFQEPMTSLSPVHTVGDQIIEAIRLHQEVSKKQARHRAIDLLRMVGIPRPEMCVDEYAFRLSGGLRQRAMIAVALACDPKILIADEPTTALDVTTQAQILELLCELQEQRGMAVLLITHNMGVIAEMADDVVVMYLGQVAEKGSVDDIFHAPKHPYTQALVRLIPSVLSRPRTRLPSISGAVPHPYNRPSGCLFHPRCPDFVPGICDVREPGCVRSGYGHEVSCFLYEG